MPSISTILISLLLLTETFASPFHGISGRARLAKRATPKLSTTHKFTDLQVAQLHRAFADALRLADAAAEAIKKDFPLTGAYFRAEHDLQNAQKIFERIANKDDNDVLHGADDLGHLTFSPDFIDKDTKEESCINPWILAATRHGEETNPIVIICPNAFQHGHLPPGAAIPGAPAGLTCDSVVAGGDRTTYRMDSLASTILHEYTHFGDLMHPQLSQGTADDYSVPGEPDRIHVHGAWGTQELRRGKYSDAASQIAESYAWLATHAFWAQHCHITGAPPHKYGLATSEGDDDDPVCHVPVAKAGLTGGQFAKHPCYQ